VLASHNWRYKAELIAACSCDWGCPCNFNARPTHGYCNGAYALNLRDGNFDQTDLKGTKFVWAASWPGAIHEGRGICKILIDVDATPEQRAAVEGIVKGEHGGLPWSIFMNTIDQWLPVSYVPFEWKYDGANSSYKAGTEAQATLISYTSPVTGADASAQILLPNGIVTKEVNVTATKSFAVFSKGLKYAEPGRYGFYAVTEHTNK
jgi:hypothetical protein